MKSWRFEIPGKLLGYRASVRRCFDPKYAAYKQTVGLLALAAGIPPLDPRQSEVYVSTFIHWKRNPRIDWDNVQKAVVDALFHQDRWIRPGRHSGFITNADSEEYAVVRIEVMDGR